ncbi:zinc finger protein 182-like [Macrosteles quadrilineatus]|uniref:zinc finger protein 182-like n=1 Tax=Macrosteles quadrilineatus TaxID=74068 RepID=UPI0023E2CBC3|nr:zinc finger protein 182-like [Macrosteles quadrilineatus]
MYIIFTSMTTREVTWSDIYKCFSSKTIKGKSKLYRMKYKCPMCFEEFCEEYLLNKHIQIRHEVEMVLKEENVTIKQENNFLEEVPLVQTKEIGRKHSLDHINDLVKNEPSIPVEENMLLECSQNHSGENSREKCLSTLNEENTLRDQDSVIYPLVQIEYKHHQCHLCKKTFTKNGHLKVHLLSHSSKRPFECVVCNKTFTQSGNLRRHLTTHVNERPRQCTFCDQTFAQVGQLKLHLLIHTDGKPYQCTVCEKSFTQKGDLNRHMLIHSQERPHECHLCDQKFKQSSHLKSHLLTHTGQRPHQCTMCDKAYKESGHLRRHMQTHADGRPYQCTICDKAYIRREHLKRHLITHSK